MTRTTSLISATAVGGEKASGVLYSQAMGRSVRFVVMPRRRRFASGGLVYRVLNRAVARDRLVRKPADYQAIEDVLEEAKDCIKGVFS